MPVNAVPRSLAMLIKRQIRRDAADMVDFASELVRVPSENPPGKAYPKCAALIARRLREMGLAVRTVNPTGEGPCVLGTLGSGGRALYFSGHYDVVPAQDRAQFEPVVRNGHLHGRGSADMKGWHRRDGVRDSRTRRVRIRAQRASDFHLGAR